MNNANNNSIIINDITIPIHIPIPIPIPIPINMSAYYDIINKYINTIFINDFPEILQDQIKYILNDGKKIRSILYLSFSNYINFSNNNINYILPLPLQIPLQIPLPLPLPLPLQIPLQIQLLDIILFICVAIELLHCVSLIIDDLPDIDNDDIRRNKPSFHIKFGIEYTHFFIYYILNKIYILLHSKLDILITLISSQNNITNNIINYYKQCIKNIINLCSININELLDGQYIDLEYLHINSNSNSNSNTTDTNINSIHNTIIHIIHKCINSNKDKITIENIDKNILLNLKKTGSLFALSCSISVLVQSLVNNIHKTHIDTHIDTYITDTEASTALLIWGYILGYFFQISDDILDYHSDIINNKPNICNILGMDDSILLFNNCCEWLENNINDILLQFNRKKENNELYFDIQTILQIIKKIKVRM